MFYLALLIIPTAVLALPHRVPRISFTHVADNYPHRVFEAQGTVLDDGKHKYLFVAGGFFKFPGVTKECWRRRVTAEPAPWERLADMPLPITHMAQTAFGHIFCGAGGYYGSHPGRSVSVVLCYNMLSDEWHRMPNLPADRAGGGMLLVGSTLMYAGGVDREFNSLHKHIDYGDAWTIRVDRRWVGWSPVYAKMPDPRNHMAAVNSCGRLFWVGGQHEEYEGIGNRRSVTEFLWKAGQWRYVASLPIPIGHISASVMPYKCGILVVAGATWNRRRIADVHWYDPVRNRWHAIGKYPCGAATPVCGIMGETVMCATAGSAAVRNRVYIGNLF